jgi:hypothetical protein
MLETGGNSHFGKVSFGGHFDGLCACLPEGKRALRRSVKQASEPVGGNSLFGSTVAIQKREGSCCIIRVALTVADTAPAPTQTSASELSSHGDTQVRFVEQIDGNVSADWGRACATPALPLLSWGALLRGVDYDAAAADGLRIGTVHVVAGAEAVVVNDHAGGRVPNLDPEFVHAAASADVAVC